MLKEGKSLPAESIIIREERRHSPSKGQREEGKQEINAAEKQAIKKRQIKEQ